MSRTLGERRVLEWERARDRDRLREEARVRDFDRRSRPRSRLETPREAIPLDWNLSTMEPSTHDADLGASSTAQNELINGTSGPNLDTSDEVSFPVSNWIDSLSGFPPSEYPGEYPDSMWQPTEHSPSLRHSMQSQLNIIPTSQEPRSNMLSQFTPAITLLHERFPKGHLIPPRIHMIRRLIAFTGHLRDSNR